MEAPVMRLVAGVAVLTLLAVLAGAAAPPPLWDKLGARVAEVERRLDGVLGLSVRDVASGTVLEIRATEDFPAASTIKVAILYELFRQADEGRIDLAEITRPPLPRVGGGGVLQELSDRVALTWRDLAVLMIGWSDNEAANRLADKVGMDAVEKRMTVLALPGVRLRRKMMDLEAARRGFENTATARELRRLMDTVWEGTGLTPARAADLRQVAATAESYSDIRAALPEGTKAITKSGELTGVRAEAAYVDLPGRPYSVAVMTKFLRRDTEGASAIREISAILYDTFDRLARSSEHGRILSD
ncbi:MAG TPA: serine hydrolase [Vicinamibacteria bacterium]